MPTGMLTVSPIRQKENKIMKSKIANIAFSLLIIAGSLFCPVIAWCQNVQIVFTSDAHYGITRQQFRGDTAVAGHIVNAALVKQINTLPAMVLPADGGINAGNTVGGIDYVIEGGDIANRMEIPIQSAAISWSQFETDYMKSLNIKGHDGKPATLLMVPGNHDISNAIGFTKPMKPLTDPTSMVSIYNLMLKPAVPLTNATYDYAVDKINYSRNIHGIHFEFITLWPDSAERIWIPWRQIRR
jgi:predicted MPP superfamily phosphohydrolase